MTLTPQRLRRLVKQRERLEKLQEGELAEALRLYRRREDALNESKANREALLDGPSTGGAVDLADLLAAGEYLRRVDREIVARGAALQHSANDVEEERAELMVRRRDRKAMEALLDKRLEEERIERARAELRLIDELATTRWRPAKPGGRP
ncbi:MAG TPA: flagellar export protein FliJ [Tepidiformaceae bacterium]|nr:flagellar export protein FliJ [Tepidiformaceae bacterium]